MRMQRPEGGWMAYLPGAGAFRLFRVGPLRRRDCTCDQPDCLVAGGGRLAAVTIAADGGYGRLERVVFLRHG